MSKTEKQKEIISITHFINPHLFWYHKVNVCNDDYRTILEIEKELAQYYIDRQAWTQGLRHPTIKSMVAVKFLAWNKMIRARVDHIAGFGKNVTGGEFIMWAIDYGFPFQTKADHIYVLPEKLTTPVDYIHCGGLVNVLPAEHFFMKNTMVKNVTRKWHQRACDVVEKAINNSECIVFTKEYNFNGQDWGELVVKTNMGVKYRIKDHLISLHLALDVESSNFQNQCKKLDTVKILPWMCNNGNSKFHANRVYLYPGVIGGMTHNGAKLAALECIEAKQKVEEWYERCETGNDANILDTTSEYTMTEGSIDALSIRKYDQQYETDLTKIDEDEESQHMQLAGVLTKSRIERLSTGKLVAPRLPSTIDFDMKSESTKINQTIETTDSEISSIKFVPLQDSTLNNDDDTVRKTAPECVQLEQKERERNIERDLVLKKIKEIKYYEEPSTPSTPKSEEIGLYAEYLINLRKMYIESKADEELSDSTINEDFETYNNNFKFPTITKTNDDRHEADDKKNKTFYGLRMIPAGFDIMNLHDYNDGQHWHCKKTTLNDRVPHNDLDLLNYVN
ncbi:uncharacterized protein [Eurosta solidaginis]|uniref:uncharacterized protein n=1 Tax=Eurosta solidaginis TaxID=178769 RepID=UPI003530AC95